MRLVDTHCHIQSIGAAQGERMTQELWAKATDITADGVIGHAVEAGIDTMICVGCDLADSQLAIDFAAERDNCWVSIGIHPHEAAAAQDHQSAFTQLVTAPKVIAIGECGLDYFYEHSPRAAQITILEFQLQLALDHNLPVIFHVRDALDDFWPILDNFGGKIRGVLHSFTDTAQQMQRGVDRGLYFGVNGIMTFAKRREQLAMYRTIPDERLLLETDAPYLTPVPFRGKINTPEQIGTIAKQLADLRSTSVENLAQITTNNVHTLFGI